MAILCFIGSTMTRLLLEFELYKSARKIAGWGVVWAMLGVQSFLISYVNTTQHSWLSLLGLTKEVISILWSRARSYHQYPMMVCSACCFSIALVLCIVFLFPPSIHHDQLSENDRYT